MGKKKTHDQKKAELQYLLTEKRAPLVVGIVIVVILVIIGLYFAIPGIGTIQISGTPQPTLIPTITQTPPTSIEYVLKENESLWDVANRYYGDPTLYTKIAYDNNFSNPDLIAPGTKLLLKGIVITPKITVREEE